MKCPGQDSRYWQSDAIFDAKCPECGADVEFFKDDTTRKCKNLDGFIASYSRYRNPLFGMHDNARIVLTV